MKSVMMTAFAAAALLCIGSAANANSVNGTDDYHPSVLQMPPDCQPGTNEETAYCSRSVDNARHMDERQNAVGTSHTTVQPNNGE